MRQPLKLVTTLPAARASVTLDQVKLSLKIEPDVTDDDALIAGLIRTATDVCERATGRALISRTLTLWLDTWPSTNGAGSRIMELPRPPLRSVAFIKTYDTADIATALDSSAFFVDTAGDIGRIALRTGTPVPLSGRAVNGIEIRFDAGYGDYPADIPEPLRAGIERLVAHLYEHRGDDPAMASLASGADALWRPYRVIRL